MNKKKKINFYIQYSCLFILFMFLILFFYYSKDKATVNDSNDGFKQFYRALLYISNYYKEILRNIFINHTFVIPQWDFVLGEGGDIIETFHYYGLGDPINLLSVFFNESNLYIFHDLSIFIRMYLAGFVFSQFCFYNNYNDSVVVLTGTILYAFSSYAFRVLTNYIYFINPLIYFPLIILGVEKIIKENKGTTLIIGVALASITSIYFFYMIVLATVIYVTVRLLTININLKEIVNKVFNIFMYSFFGLLISSVIFFPAAYSMLGNSRVGGGVQIQLFYSPEHYLNLFTQLIFNNYSGWYYGGYTILGFFGIASIVLNKGNKTLKWLLIVSLVIMSFPLFGSLFNGMTYIVNRYEFFLTFLVIFCVVASYDKISNSNKKIVVYFILLCIYTLASILRNDEEIKTYILFFGLGVIVLLCFAFIKCEKTKKYIFLLSALFSILFTIAYKYSSNYWNHAEKNGSDIVKLTNIHNEEPSIFNKINDNTFYRYSGNSLPDNVSINGAKSSTGYYWSVANNNIADFRTYNGFHDETNFYFSNYDGDYILNTLSGVKYYFAKDGEKIPYNYKLYKKYDNYNLYVNQNALPIVYGYGQMVSIDNYKKMSILDRKELISSAVVANDEMFNDYAFKSNVKEMNVNISNTDGIIFSKDTILTTAENSKIELKYNSNISGEYYFVVEDLYTDVEMYISVTNNQNINKGFSIKTRNSHAYDGRHSFAINLGYYNGLNDTVTLNIPLTSNMTYRKLGIYCLPLEESVNNLKKLNCVDINDLKFATNTVITDVNLTKDKYLCFSIPNYDGWTAYVDGKKKELKQYNIMYMGFPIEKGEHHIELNYSTPFLKEGFIVSIASLSLFIVIKITKKRKNKTKR